MINTTIFPIKIVVGEGPNLLSGDPKPTCFFFPSDSINFGTFTLCKTTNKTVSITVFIAFFVKFVSKIESGIGVEEVGVVEEVNVTVGTFLFPFPISVVGKRVSNVDFSIGVRSDSSVFGMTSIDFTSSMQGVTHNTLLHIA